MKLGFVSAILPEFSLSELFDFASASGYECLELMCWPVGKADRRYAGVTHIDVVGLNAARAAEINELKKSKNVSISALGYYPNALCPDEREAWIYVDHLHKCIEAAATLGVGTVNTFIGRDSSRSVEANWDRFLSTWRPLIALAEDRNVRVAIENCPMFFSSDEWPGGKNLAISPAIWRKMFEAIPSPNFGLNYDPSHLVWQQMDYIKPLREFAPRIFHVHAKDAKIDRQRLDEVGILVSPLEYHSPKLPGLGDIHWGRFMSELSDVGYTGPVCVEVEDRAYEGSLEGKKQALTQVQRFLRNYSG